MQRAGRNPARQRTIKSDLKKEKVSCVFFTPFVLLKNRNSLFSKNLSLHTVSVTFSSRFIAVALLAIVQFYATVTHVSFGCNMEKTDCG